MIYIYDIFRFCLVASVLIIIFKVRADVKLRYSFKWGIYFLYIPFLIYFGGFDVIGSTSIISFSDYYPIKSTLIFLVFVVSTIVITKRSKNIWLRLAFIIPIMQCIVVFYLNYFYENRFFSLFFKGSW